MAVPFRRGLGTGPMETADRFPERAGCREPGDTAPDDNNIVIC